MVERRGRPTRLSDKWRGGGGEPGGSVLVDEEQLRKMLSSLRTEHRDLDVAIATLGDTAQDGGSVDQLQIARLKKRKLALRDRIAVVEDQLLPDIIA